jgi:hypothetical protein
MQCSTCKHEYIPRCEGGEFNYMDGSSRVCPNWNKRLDEICGIHQGAMPGWRPGRKAPSSFRVPNRQRHSSASSVIFLWKQAARNPVSMPNPQMQRINTYRLWHNTLARASFFIAISVLLRRPSPNFDFIIDRLPLARPVPILSLVGGYLIPQTNRRWPGRCAVGPYEMAVRELRLAVGGRCDVR